MTKHHTHRVSRRTFVKQTAGGALAAMAAPAIVTAAKTDAEKTIVGSGDYQYKADHNWAKLPDKFTWQTTHNVAIGSDGLVYVIHEGRDEQPDHDSIFVFDPDGAFVRSFGREFQGGGHGLELRREGSEEYVYVAAYLSKRSFAKLTTKGDVVWHKFAPMEAGGYNDEEDDWPHKGRAWGRDRFNPTNFAFLPEGGFLLTDGYGSYRVHRYDAEGNWKSSFGSADETEAKPEGTFNLPHGIWIDDRGDEPLVVVADRVNARLQWFTLDGEHRATLDGFLLPANVDRRGDLLVVPDLVGRVTLLDSKNKVIAHLGDDSERINPKNPDFSIRGDESKWLPGKFIHPHDACFDADGNIYVAEWVARGRVTKLTKI